MELALSKPNLRATMESLMKRVCTGEKARQVGRSVPAQMWRREGHAAGCQTSAYKAYSRGAPG